MFSWLFFHLFLKKVKEVLPFYWRQYKKRSLVCQAILAQDIGTEIFAQVVNIRGQ